jgi:hypothetical protein
MDGWMSWNNNLLLCKDIYFNKWLQILSRSMLFVAHIFVDMKYHKKDFSTDKLVICQNNTNYKRLQIRKVRLYTARIFKQISLISINIWQKYQIIFNLYKVCLHHHFARTGVYLIKVTPDFLFIVVRTLIGYLHFINC